MGGILHLPHPQPQSPGVGGWGMKTFSCFWNALTLTYPVKTTVRITLHVSGEGWETRLFTGDVNAAPASPAGGRQHDNEPALPSEELWAELHPQDEDRSAGTRSAICRSETVALISSHKVHPSQCYTCCVIWAAEAWYLLLHHSEDLSAQACGADQSHHTGLFWEGVAVSLLYFLLLYKSYAGVNSIGKLIKQLSVLLILISLLFFHWFQVLSLDKGTSAATNSTPSSVQVRKNDFSSPTPQPSNSSESSKPPLSTSGVPHSASVPAQDVLKKQKEAKETVKSRGSMDFGGGGGGQSLAESGRSLAESGKSSSNLAISGSQQYLAGGKEPTPSIASDVSNPYASHELQQRLEQLHKYLSVFTHNYYYYFYIFRIWAHFGNLCYKIDVFDWCVTKV